MRDYHVVAFVLAAVLIVALELYVVGALVVALTLYDATGVS